MPECVFVLLKDRSFLSYRYQTRNGHRCTVISFNSKSVKHAKEFHIRQTVLALKGSWRCKIGDWRGGEKRQLSPIGKSVSVSFRVRVVRACVHAKLRGRARRWDFLRWGLDRPDVRLLLLLLLRRRFGTGTVCCYKRWF